MRTKMVPGVSTLAIAALIAGAPRAFGAPSLSEQTQKITLAFNGDGTVNEDSVIDAAPNPPPPDPFLDYKKMRGSIGTNPIFWGGLGHPLGDWNDGFIARLREKASYQLYDAGRNILDLPLGRQFKSSIKADIEQARHFIHIEVFQWEPNAYGHELAAELIKKAQGPDRVKVRVILDEYGSFVDNDKTQEESLVAFMREGGVDVQVRPRPRLPAMHLDHRKVWAMDNSYNGMVCYTGGMNLGDDYQNTDQEGWHDQQTRVVGRACNRLQDSFLIHWKQVTGVQLKDLELYPTVADVPGGAKTYVITHDGGNSDYNIKWAYILAIDTAKDGIRIEDPYFTDRDVIAHLMAAGRRGLPKGVQIIVPAKDDEKSTLHAIRCHYPEIIASGVEVWEYQPKMEHMKVAVMDDYFSMMGSSNLDAQSLVWNDELDLIVLDPFFGTEIDKRIFNRDMGKSVRLTSYDPTFLDCAYEKLHPWL